MYALVTYVNIHWSYTNFKMCDYDIWTDYVCKRKFFSSTCICDATSRRVSRSIPLQKWWWWLWWWKMKSLLYFFFFFSYICLMFIATHTHTLTNNPCRRTVRSTNAWFNRFIDKKQRERVISSSISSSFSHFDLVHTYVIHTFRL